MIRRRTNKKRTNRRNNRRKDRRTNRRTNRRKTSRRDNKRNNRRSNRKVNSKRSIKNHPDFKPNQSPKQVFKKGAFGGTYFRPINSSITGKSHRSSDVIREYPKSWFSGINIETHVTSSKYDKKINKYGVKCGSSLEDWESSGWIVEQDPYGWFQWYCRYYKGRRTKDDERQIERWKKLAGPNGRFRKRLINMIKKKNTTYDDETVSPVIRQVLLHWAYELRPGDL